MSDDAIAPGPPSTPSVPDTRLTRVVTAALIGAFLIAVAAPVRRLGRPGVRDSFPFSHYPMFSNRRERYTWVFHLLGVRTDGSVSPLHYSYAGGGGLNAVRRQLRRRVLDGDGQALAERAARSVSTRDRGAESDVVRVHVVRGRYLIEPFMTGADTTTFTDRLQVRGSADVPGREHLREEDGTEGRSR